MGGDENEKWKVVASSDTSAEEVARRALNKVLADSVTWRIEYGAMICRKAGKYVALKARTQHEPNKVDVGQEEENCGCPPGWTPVAYYHTHPLYSQAGMKAEYNEFSDDDIGVAHDHKIDAYVGTLDGSFLKYDYKLGKPALRLRGRLKNG